MSSLTPVVGEQYVAPEDTSLSVTRRNAKIGDGNFTITDSDGKALFKLTEPIVKLTEKRTLYNHADTAVVTLHKKAISLHDTWVAYAGESNDTAFTLKKSHIRDKAGVESYDINVGGTSKDPEYIVKGDFVHRSYSIVYGGDYVVAEVSKAKFSLSSLFGRGKHNYGVRVNGGADLAFVAAIVTIIDAVHTEDKEQKGEGSSSSDDE